MSQTQQHIICLFFLLLLASIFAQESNLKYYAIMDYFDAKKLQLEYPKDFKIIANNDMEAAMLLSDHATHIIHQRILVHGPGYHFQPSKEKALKALNEKTFIRSKSQEASFTITEQEVVNQVKSKINTQNIENHIRELESYGTRYHTTSRARQSANDLKSKWETMAALYQRTDVSVRLVNHRSTRMPSVVLTITGSKYPDQFIIVGGHMDSTSSRRNSRAPGADDDASGIATITEATRALFEIGFYPERTIEVMAYAAEEVGLRGSGEIADTYLNNNTNVLAVCQFDMTNFNGGQRDIYFIGDNTDPDLNNYMMSLLDTYHSTGIDRITYSTTLCNYGCSDHASWHRRGFRTTFPFEADFSNYNRNIHTPRDTFNVSGTATHAAKFAKLCAEFLIETAKSSNANELSLFESISTTTIDEDIFTVYVQDNYLHYALPHSKTTKIFIYNMLGKRVRVFKNLKSSGNIPMNSLNHGVYIVSFEGKGQQQLFERLILK